MPEGQTKNENQQEDKQLYERYLKTTSKQAGMVFGTRVIGYLLGFAMQAIFARFLGPDKYGLYSLGLTVANVGVLIGTFGLNVGMTRFLGEHLGKKDFSKAKGTIFSGFKWSIIFSSISALVIFLFREQIAIKIFKEERLIPLLPWFSIVLILLTLMNIFRGVLQGFKKPSVFTFYKEVIERAIRIGAFLILYLIGIEVLGVVIATLLSSLIVVLRLTLWLHKNATFLSNKKEKTTKDTKKLLSYSSNMLFVTFTYFLMGQVNRLIIGGFLDSRQVGLYSISDTVANLSVFFLVAFNTIFQPIISEVFHKKKDRILSDLYSHITRLITTLTIPIIIWIVVYSKEILSIFGTEYTVAKWTLIILALGQFANAVTGTCGSILNMTKYQRFEMLNGLLIAGVNIGLNIWLIPIFGIVGSALAGAFAMTIVNFTKLFEVLILLKLFPYNKKFFKLFLPTILTFISMYFLNSFFSNFIAVIIGLIGSFSIFFITLLLMKLPPEDKMIIKAVINRLKR